MLLVDSSVWIDFFNGNNTQETNYLDNVLDKELILIGDIILCEVLQGFNSDKDYYTAKEHLSKFHSMQMLNMDIAIKSAENFRKLRKKGITIRKTIDCIIATYCIENNLRLLSNDRDFMPFKDYLNLKIIEL